MSAPEREINGSRSRFLNASLIRSFRFISSKLNWDTVVFDRRTLYFAKGGELLFGKDSFLAFRKLELFCDLHKPSDQLVVGFPLSPMLLQQIPSFLGQWNCSRFAHLYHIL